MTSRVSHRKERLSLRWGFLEKQVDACSVVTRRMEVIYLNAAARSLLPPKWFGRRCWEVFPMGDRVCAARCPAILAVSKSQDIIYCEETLYGRDGSPVPLGVAVIPLRVLPKGGERAILLLRRNAPDIAQDVFQRDLLEQAAKPRTFCESLSWERRDYATGSESS